jgi:hypothetical protein
MGMSLAAAGTVMSAASHSITAGKAASRFQFGESARIHLDAGTKPLLFDVCLKRFSFRNYSGHTGEHACARSCLLGDFKYVNFLHLELVQAREKSFPFQSRLLV